MTEGVDDRARLARIRERAEAADSAMGTDWTHDSPIYTDRIDCNTWGVRCEYGVVGENMHEEVATFIAHARSDVPWLVDALEKSWDTAESLRSENERLAAAYNDADGRLSALEKISRRQYAERDAARAAAEEQAALVARLRADLDLITETLDKYDAPTDIVCSGDIGEFPTGLNLAGRIAYLVEGPPPDREGRCHGEPAADLSEALRLREVLGQIEGGVIEGWTEANPRHPVRALARVCVLPDQETRHAGSVAPPKGTGEK